MNISIQREKGKKTNIFSIFPSWQYSQTRPQLHAWLHCSRLKTPNLQRPLLFNDDPSVIVWLERSNYITEYLMYFYIYFTFLQEITCYIFTFFFYEAPRSCIFSALNFLSDKAWSMSLLFQSDSGQAVCNVCKCATAFHIPLLKAASPSTMSTGQRPGLHNLSIPASGPMGLTLMKHTAKPVPPSKGHGCEFSTSSWQLEKTLDFHTQWTRPRTLSAKLHCDWDLNCHKQHRTDFF